jgi:ATP-dependent helicase/nuclease subunit A
MGVRLTDSAVGVSWATLPLTAIRRRAKREELSEWERLLYVAMTRARERLILSYAVDEPEEALAALGGPSDTPIPPQLLAAEANLGKWLLRAAAADGGRTIRVRCVRAGELAEQAHDEAAREALPAAAEDVRALTERIAWRYPAAAAEELPSKLTATGLRRETQERDPEAMALERTPRRERRRKPELGGAAARALTGAERGVAAHLVMQHIDFAKTGSLEDIAGEIARLREQGFLDERQAAAVPPADIAAFFRSEIGVRLLAAEKVLREFRFSLLCPAERWFPDAPAGEEILLQGVVDCCIEEDGALTVIDFKTDRDIEPARHADQVEAYAMAMERVTGKPVRGAALWYLRHKKAVYIPLKDKKTVAIPGKV